MTSEDPSAAAAAGGGRRKPRQGSGGSPVGSTLSIVLAVVAVIAGFLILRNLTDDGGSGGSTLAPSGESGAAGSTTSTTFDIGGAVTTTTSTTIPRVTDGATVVVANANSVGGSAGRMSKTLETAGYTMGSPVNASTGAQDATIVYFDATVATAEAVAQSVGIDMGCITVEPVPTPPPTEDGTLAGAGVLVVLGDDQADKTLEELAAGCVTTAAAPAVSGSSDSTTTTTTG